MTQQELAPLTRMKECQFPLTLGENLSMLER